MVGKDDKVILNELFNQIKDIDYKIYAGISDIMGKIDIVSINVRTDEFKTLILGFISKDMKKYDKLIENIENTVIKKDDYVRIVDREVYDKVVSLIKKIKKVENVKSHGIAFLKMVELAEKKIKEIYKNSKK